MRLDSDVLTDEERILPGLFTENSIFAQSNSYKGPPAVATFDVLVALVRRARTLVTKREHLDLINEALATGVGRVESVVLPHGYAHLSPLVDAKGSRAQEPKNVGTAPVDSEPPRPSMVDFCPAGASVCEELRRGAEVCGLQAVQRSVDLHKAEPSGLHQHA